MWKFSSGRKQGGDPDLASETMSLTYFTKPQLVVFAMSALLMIICPEYLVKKAYWKARTLKEVLSKFICPDL